MLGGAIYRQARSQVRERSGKDKAWRVAHAPIGEGKAQWHISVVLSFRERRESGAS